MAMQLAPSIWSFYCCVVDFDFYPFIGINFSIFTLILFSSGGRKSVQGIWARSSCASVFPCALVSIRRFYSLISIRRRGPNVRFNKTQRLLPFIPLLCVSSDAARLHFSRFYCDFSSIRLTDSVSMSEHVVLNCLLLSSSPYHSQPRD